MGQFWAGQLLCLEPLASLSASYFNGQRGRLPEIYLVKTMIWRNFINLAA
jgi:hypothetical protein